jgi:GNAT superfamily N-acetyltransferase
VSDLAIRRAAAEDLPAIVALLDDDEQSRGREDATLPLEPRYLAAFNEIDGNPDQFLAVAEQDGTLVGSMQLTFIPGIAFRGAWRMQIEAVRIASAVRGQGLGAAMIGWAVDQARARGCRMVQLTSMSTRTDAHRFYERLGFVKSHVGMKLHLTDTAA